MNGLTDHGPDPVGDSALYDRHRSLASRGVCPKDLSTRSVRNPQVNVHVGVAGRCVGQAILSMHFCQDQSWKNTDHGGKKPEGTGPAAREWHRTYEAQVVYAGEDDPLYPQSPECCRVLLVA